jgi:hypothetical protein
MGGLGNQIFQIFATIAYSIKSKNQAKFVNTDTLLTPGCTIRYTFWQTFFYNLKPFLITQTPNPMHIIREKSFAYNELSIDEISSNNNVLLYGYFQSYKYFENHYSSIYRFIGIDKMKESLLNKIKLTSHDLNTNISLHFRLGDFKSLQNKHPITTYNYYEGSLKYIQNKIPNENFTILFFCEDSDYSDVLLTIKKLQNKFPDYNFIRGDRTLADWEQLLLMSCCHHNIIANSSFSWWGAYFNLHADKIVCYPSLWFGPALNHDTKDLCPPEWVKINV